MYERFINPQATERRSLIVSRVLVVALGIFALLQATQFESILNASLYAYTVYGAAVTPVVLAVFFWKRTTTAGAMTRSRWDGDHGRMECRAGAWLEERYGRRLSGAGALRSRA